MTTVLLTNDDGIDAPGLRAVHDALADAYDVVVVAPADDQSGVGGARTWWQSTVEYDDHELGYAVEGTPADCVALAVSALSLDPDVVVSGCNDGPNLGAHILGRSGTVGAALEAAFLGIPGVAVSMYDRENLPPASVVPEDFEFPAAVVRRILDEWVVVDDAADETSGARFVGPVADADYLNVNAPANPGADGEDGTLDAVDVPTRLTRPAEGYEVMEVDPETDGYDARGETGVELRDRFWRRFLELDVPDPVGTDRRSAVDGEVSVSPLRATSGGGPRVGETVGLSDPTAAADD